MALLAAVLSFYLRVTAGSCAQGRRSKTGTPIYKTGEVALCLLRELCRHAKKEKEKTQNSLIGNKDVPEGMKCQGWWSVS